MSRRRDACTRVPGTEHLCCPSLHGMDEELLDGSEPGPARLGVEQARAFQSLERQVRL